MSDPILSRGFPVPSEEEHMRCIGAFVCRLAQIVLLRSQPVVRHPATVLVDADPDERVLVYLSGVREASPVEIRATLGLSRSMTYRVLQRLVLLRQVASRGSTKSVVYCALPVDPMRN